MHAARLPCALETELNYHAMSLPLPLYTAAQLREIDRRAIEVQSITGAELMARAGHAAFDAVRTHFPHARRLGVVCGPGNNGGDGYVIARLAKEAGLEPLVCTLGSAPAKGDAAHMRERLAAAGVVPQPFDASAIAGCDVIVDALLGTGLQRRVEGAWRDAIEAINASGRPVVAIDVPSGLSSDTGAVLGTAVRAHLTVTFIGLKAGLFTADGGDCAGEIVFADLRVPVAAYAEIEPVARRIAGEALRGVIRPRRRNAHKGEFGHVLVVGGGRGMAGAARLCGEAALRTGAGLVTLAAHPDHADAANAARPELLAFAVRGAADLKPLIERASVVALGPGLGKDAWSKAVWRAALDAGLPLVVDADALNLLAASPKRKNDWILTPHPGEAGRLLKCSTRTVQDDRFEAAAKLVKRYGGVCVLKGAGTLVRSGGVTWLCDRGNPGMASGGSGDVLTGVIAALRAQGLSPEDAARAGTWIHASAGDDAAGAGEAGLIASDLFPYIRRRMNELAHDDDQR